MSSRRHLGWNPMPRNPRPRSSATALTSLRWLSTSLQVWWMFSSGAPDSSSWPAGSSVTDAPSRSRATVRPFSSTLSQPKRPSPRSSDSIPRSPSNCGGRRSSRRKPNFSCSVPMRQSALGFSPEATYSTSWSRPVTGVSLAWLELDMRTVLEAGRSTPADPAPWRHYKGPDPRPASPFVGGSGPNARGIGACSQTRLPPLLAFPATAKTCGSGHGRDAVRGTGHRGHGRSHGTTQARDTTVHANRLQLQPAGHHLPRLVHPLLRLSRERLHAHRVAEGIG